MKLAVSHGHCPPCRNTNIDCRPPFVLGQFKPRKSDNTTAPAPLAKQRLRPSNTSRWFRQFLHR